MCQIKKLYGYQGVDPFFGFNGRDFSDKAIQEEFCPTSQFWSLFNPQHEILLGTRGCGKTFLLKSMRRSILKQLDAPQAQEIVSQKQFITFYIALFMERMSALNSISRDPADKIKLFRFIFNSSLAIAILYEAKNHCFDIEATDKEQALQLNSDLADHLYKTWYNIEKNTSIVTLNDLIRKVNNTYIQFNFETDNIDTLPRLFFVDLCAPLTAANEYLSEFWDTQEPTWIIALDEAEFIDEEYQKIINSYLRSNPMHVVFKIATLPYYWKTLDTLNKDVEISNGNDFTYRVLDMDCDSNDFKKLTNKLCSNRLQRIKLNNKTIDSSSLEKLLGTVGNDKRIDYFKNEMEDLSDEDIKKGILLNLSPTRKDGSASKKDLSQTIYKKYAPIYYVREIRKKIKGRYIPKWFAGSEVVRKVSQGNPRMFIMLMAKICRYANKHPNFDLKDQHKIISQFADDICNSSKCIEKDGETISKNLDDIALQLQKKTHDEFLNEIGCSFRLNIDDYSKDETSWIKRAIAFSRLSVDESTIVQGISDTTKFTLCNAYAVKYWLTMRSDYPVPINLSDSPK